MLIVSSNSRPTDKISALIVKVLERFFSLEIGFILMLSFFSSETPPSQGLCSPFIIDRFSFDCALDLLGIIDPLAIDECLCLK